MREVFVPFHHKSLSYHLRRVSLFIFIYLYKMIAFPSFFRAYILAIAVLFSIKVQAYHVIINGVAKGVNAKEVRLSSSAWVDEQVAFLNESGTFSFTIDHPYPAMFSLKYGTGLDLLRADVFLLNDLLIDASLTHENGMDNVFLKVPDRRSAALKTAKNYMENLYVDKNVDVPTLRKIIPEILAIPNIGNDDFSQKYAAIEMLNFMQTMSNNYGKKLEKSYLEMEEFSNLPKNDNRYMGIEAYRDLMVAYNEYLVKQRISQQTNILSFSGLSLLTDSIAAMTPEAVRYDMNKRLVKKFKYSHLVDGREKELYAKKLRQLLNNYPEAPEASALQEKIMDIMLSIENNPAPDFHLADESGTIINYEDFKGTFLLIDVWGSWCRPCRVKNPKLVELYNQCQTYDIKVTFVGVAAKEQDTESWKEAIENDGLTWLQLWADEKFLHDYHIQEYPTMILIDKKGIIRKMSPNIGLEDLINFVMLAQ
ncbi:MAG: TlpA family protein disulfide reductase [Bacteroidia bacterium]